MSVYRFTAATNTLTVAGAASPTAQVLPIMVSPTRVARVCNSGTVAAQVRFGGAAVTADATAPYVALAGESFTVSLSSDMTHAAVYAASGTPPVHITLGQGE